MTALDPVFMEWLHRLSIEAYKYGTYISAEYDDAVKAIYVLYDRDDIEACFEAYQDFKRRWTALHSVGGDLHGA